MRGINHPSITKLYGFFESPDYYFLILERECFPFLRTVVVLDTVQFWRAASSSIRS